MDLSKNGFNLSNMAIGVGIILAMPVAVPLLGRVIRPATKALIMVGMVAYKESEKCFASSGSR
jgi:hypothetical protein